MCYFKEKSVFILFIFLSLTLFLLRPQFVYSQNNEFDTDPPEILQVSPGDGETGVPVNTSIMVYFNEFMDTTLTENSFLINPSIAGEFSWENSYQTLLFSPDKFFYNTPYNVTVGTQAADLFGNTLENSYDWSFVTQTSPWRHFDEIQGLSLDQQNVQEILGEDNGDVWVALFSSGPSDDLFVFNGIDPDSFQKFDEPFGHISALAQDGTGIIWVTSVSDEPSLGGVHTYDGTDWMHYNSTNSDLSDNAIKCLTIASDDTIWVGSSYSGIYRLDRSDGASWTNYDTDNSNLADDLVTAIHVDETDLVWIATFGGGIQSYNTQADTWTNHTSDIESQLGLGVPFTSKLVSGFGKIWAGTSSGLLSLNINTGLWELSTQIDDYLLDGRLNTIAWDALNDKLLVGTTDGWIIFDGTNWDSMPLEGVGPEVLAIAVDAYGNSWLGTNNTLSMYDVTSPILVSFSPSSNQKNVSRKSNIVLNFSEPMDVDSVEGALKITPSISYSISTDSHYSKFTINPKGEFRSAKTYKITLSTAATDVQGNQLANSYSWSFKTVRTTTTTGTTGTTVPTVTTIPLGGFFPSTFQFPSLGGFQIPTYRAPQFPSLGFQFPGLGGFQIPSFRPTQFPSVPSVFGFPSFGIGGFLRTTGLGDLSRYTYTYPSF